MDLGTPRQFCSWLICWRVRRALAWIFCAVLLSAVPASAQVTVIDPLSGKPIDPAVVAAVAQAMEAAQKADPHNSANHTAQAGLMAACVVDFGVSMFRAGQGSQINQAAGFTAVQRPLQYGLLTLAACGGASAGLWQQHEHHPDLTRWVARILSGVAMLQAMRGQQLLGTD